MTEIVDNLDQAARSSRTLQLEGVGRSRSLGAGWLFWIVGAFCLTCVACAAEDELCPDVVTTISWQGSFGKLDARASRVEIRRCGLDENFGTLQIAAWAAGESKPVLLVDAGVSSIRQVVSIEGCVAIQLAHRSADEVRVIVFEQGKPRLAGSHVTKRGFVISASETAISVTNTNEGWRPHFVRYRLKNGKLEVDQQP